MGWLSSPCKPEVVSNAGFLASIALWARRKHYAWAWRIRYWWMDTPSGARARGWLLALLSMTATVQVIVMAVAAALPRPPHQPAKSVVWWIVWLIVAIVVAVLAVAMRPKQQQQKPQNADGPTVTDGQAVKRHYGEVWISDEFVLAWKMMGTEPIKSGGGKK